MIVGKHFVWLHLPKSGGHAVDQALKRVLRGRDDVAFDPANHAGWHDSVEDRRRRDPALQLSGRTVIAGFRRLPHWNLSRVHYGASRPPYLSATREMLCAGEFFHQNGHVGKADEYMLHYGGWVQRWVRTEHMADDFERHFGALFGSRVASTAARKLRRIVNGTELNYIRDLGFYFTPQELAGLYAANPLWAALERELYGDILTLTDRRRDSFYFLSRDMRFLAASPVALQTWGRSAEEVLGKHMLTAFPLARGSEPYEAHLRALRTRRTIELKTVSPTLAQPVLIQLAPKAAGLEGRFELVSE